MPLAARAAQVVKAPPPQSNGAAAGPSSNGAAAARNRSQPTPTSSRPGSGDDSSQEDDASSSDSGSDASSSDSDDDVPLSQRNKKTPPPKKKAAAPKKQQQPAAKRKRESTSSAAAKRPKREGSKAGSGKGEPKWSTLQHCGVLFPPEYEPHGVKMLYDGRPVELTPEQEEVASMFAIMKETDYMQKPTFLNNFWDGFKEVRVGGWGGWVAKGLCGCMRGQVVEREEGGSSGGGGGLVVTGVFVGGVEAVAVGAGHMHMADDRLLRRGVQHTGAGVNGLGQCVITAAAHEPCCTSGR